MGRGKVPIARIENKTTRQVTFSKRRVGLLKKTHELSVLCDVPIGLIIFSSSGKLFEYCSEPTSMEDIIRRYQMATGKLIAENNDPMKICEQMHGEMRQIAEEADSLELSLQRYRGKDLKSLPFDDLLQLEQQLETSVHKVRTRKNELMQQQMDNLRRKERILKEENQQIYHMMKEQQIPWEYHPEMEIGMMTYMKEEEGIMNRQVLEQFPFCGEEQASSVLQLSTLLPPPPPQFQPYSHHLNLHDFTLAPPNYDQ